MRSPTARRGAEMSDPTGAALASHEQIVNQVANALEHKRQELIAHPISRIYVELARAAIAAHEKAMKAD